jgi:hypothetical protein
MVKLSDFDEGVALPPGLDVPALRRAIDYIEKQCAVIPGKTCGRMMYHSANQSAMYSDDVASQGRPYHRGHAPNCLRHDGASALSG